MLKSARIYRLVIIVEFPACPNPVWDNGMGGLGLFN
jgi:hypothetical protein